MIFIRQIGTAICATKLETGNFIMGKGEDGKAILDSCGVTLSQLPVEVEDNDRINFLLLMCGD